MTAFDQAVNALLDEEGGYKPAAPDDPGGETNWGISKRSYPNVDIKNLSRDGAAAIYKRDFWDKFQLAALTNIPLAVKVLDMLVNSGTDEGARLIQEALNGVGLPTVVDGVFGTNTLAHCNQVEGDRLLLELKAQECFHYAKVAIAKPEEADNLLGWMRRGVKP